MKPRTAGLLLLLALPRLVSAEEQPNSNSATSVLDCPAALDRFEVLVRQTVEALAQKPADPAALSPLQSELKTLDERAGRLCLRYYTRGIELYSRLREAEKNAGAEHLLAESLPPPELPPDQKPHRPHYDVEIKDFEKPVLGEERPAVCLTAPMRPESGLVVGLLGIALGSAVGVSLLQFDGRTEHGIGYGFLFASAIFSPSAGHVQAGERLEAWLWAGGRAAAAALSIAGFAEGSGDEEADRWMGYSGAVALGILAIAGLVDGVLAVNRTNEICAPPEVKQGSTALLYLPRFLPTAPCTR